MAFPTGPGYRAHPGTKRRKYLKENAEAARIEFTESNRARIEETAPKDAAAGDRYADIGTINL